MDFDSIIPVLFIILFFVLPSILKRVKARVKTGAKEPKKNPSLFDKIGDQIRQFVQELERQAQQARQEESPEQDSLWETLSEDEKTAAGFATEAADLDTLTTADLDTLTTIVSPEKKVSEKIAPSQKKRQFREQKTPVKGMKRSLSGPYCFKSNPLQNAVIWSEILSKPVALRDK